MRMYQILNGEVREITIPDRAEGMYRKTGWRKTRPSLPDPEVSDEASADIDHDNEGDQDDS
ncbi:MAG: hypothetical protein GEU73_07645 [Chloroflexi bacterium]|nr:hypothetical protein [Chloroflexota bacterium]